MTDRKPRASERERPAVAWPTNRGLVLVAVLCVLLATLPDWAPALARLFW